MTARNRTARGSRPPARNRTARGGTPNPALDQEPIPATDNAGPAGPVVPDDGPLQPDRILPDPQQPMVHLRSAQAYEEEYALRVVHQQLLTNTPLTDIATELDTSVAEVQRYRRELYRRLKAEAGNVDMLTHAGRTLAYYDTVRGMALKMAADLGTTQGNRIRALVGSLQAEKDKHKFLQLSGFYDQIKFMPNSGADDSTGSDAVTLQDIAKAMLDPNADDSILARLTETEDASIGDALFALDDPDISLL